jgi:hypothetical protein
VHIKYLEAPLSRVRNCETDTWTDKPLARIKEKGTRIDPAATVYQRSVFIKKK